METKNPRKIIDENPYQRGAKSIEEILREKGSPWFQERDGSWSKRKRLGGLDANPAEQIAPRPLVKGHKKYKTVEGRAVVRVRQIAFRRKLLDPDAVTFAFKPSTDFIAQALGIDDADKRCEWEWLQVQTTGREGMIVIIEELI